MASASTTQAVHRITLPPCASSFGAHVGCPGTVPSAAGLSIIQCPCEKCHGAPIDVAAVCPGCGHAYDVQVVDNTVAVGNSSRTDSSTLKYCPACRASFLADLRAGR